MFIFSLLLTVDITSYFKFLPPRLPHKGEQKPGILGQVKHFCFKVAFARVFATVTRNKSKGVVEAVKPWQLEWTVLWWQILT